MSRPPLITQPHYSKNTNCNLREKNKRIGEEKIQREVEKILMMNATPTNP